MKQDEELLKRVIMDEAAGSRLLKGVITDEKGVIIPDYTESEVVLTYATDFCSALAPLTRWRLSSRSSSHARLPYASLTY